MPDDLVTPDQIAAALADESLMRQVLNGLTDEVLRLQQVNHDLYEALRNIVGAIRWEATQPEQFSDSMMTQVCRVLMKTGNVADALAALRKADGEDA